MPADVGNTDLIPERVEKRAAYDNFLTYSALGGLITTDEGKLDRMPQYKFCELFGVNEKTCLRWKRESGFAAKVRMRRDEVFPLARETAAFNRLYMIGMSGTGQPAVTALNTLLGHYSGLQLPVQRQDIKVEGGFLDVLAAAKRDGIIEGEVVHETAVQQDGSEAAPSTLPPTS